ncbi:hypothetical protein [Caproiciproducens sp.]|uniref:hypothetical protein n=1 Tax=Caproiciproducens sp. TaxID=1954376 RepID=UPI00289799B1|nr:hypothetical protein [Caproiciproducens sp.]
MDLKELLGESFKEGMSIEEINAALAEKKLVDPSILPESVSKELYNKASTEAANLRKQLKEKMTADETAAAAQKEIQEQVANLQKENSVFKFKEQFLSGGYDAKTAAELADAMASGDMAKFTAAHTKWATAHETELQAKIKADLLAETPGLGGDGGSGGGEESIGAKMAQEYNSQFIAPETK